MSPVRSTVTGTVRAPSMEGVAVRDVATTRTLPSTVVSAPPVVALAVGAAFGWLTTALSLAIPLILLLIPFYRARETRLFMNAASLGSVTLSSTLRARQFYWPYIVYFLSILGFFLVIVLDAFFAVFFERIGWI